MRMLKSWEKYEARMGAHGAHFKECSYVIEEAKYRHEEKKGRERRMEETKIVMMDPSEMHNKLMAY
jgi:hypothetical protein